MITPQEQHETTAHPRQGSKSTLRGETLARSFCYTGVDRPRHEEGREFPAPGPQVLPPAKTERTNTRMRVPNRARGTQQSPRNISTAGGAR